MFEVVIRTIVLIKIKHLWYKIICVNSSCVSNCTCLLFVFELFYLIFNQ